MTINGIDIAIYGAKQLRVEPGYSSISNDSEWMAGALSPLLLPPSTGFKKRKVFVVVHGEDRQDIWTKSQKLVAALLKPSNVALDGFKNRFRCVLGNAEQVEMSINRWHEARLELIGYEYGPTRTLGYNLKADSDTSDIIMNKGTLITPVRLELTTDNAGVLLFSMKGMFKNRFNDIYDSMGASTIFPFDRIVIDGETGKITKSKFDSVNSYPAFDDLSHIYELPRLQPGENKVLIRNLSHYDYHLGITFQERFL